MAKKYTTLDITGSEAAALLGVRRCDVFYLAAAGFLSWVRTAETHAKTVSVDSVLALKRAGNVAAKLAEARKAPKRPQEKPADGAKESAKPNDSASSAALLDALSAIKSELAQIRGILCRPTQTTLGI